MSTCILDMYTWVIGSWSCVSSRSPRSDGFTGMLPTTERSKQASKVVNTTAESSANARPVEVAIPSILAPPHALLSAANEELHTTRDRGSSREQCPQTPRRGVDEAPSVYAIPESVRKSRALEQHEQVCSEILPGFLFVGSLRVAQDTEMLRAIGITHVVNCCNEVYAFPTDDVSGIAYLKLAVRDGVQEDLLPFFPLVIQFIFDARRQPQQCKVLIHCHQGVSRSCAFAIAYIMHAERCSFHSAIAMVKARRAICSPNAAFICQLIEWERELTAAASGEEQSSAAAFGLYRLTPHASYDPHTWVLKPCYHRDSRRKVDVFTSAEAPIPSQWLWSRGAFVFVDWNSRVVVWKGREWCDEERVTRAQQLVKQMLLVYAGDAAASEMSIIVLEDSRNSVEPETDHFGYAEELSWLDQDPNGTARASFSGAVEGPTDNLQEHDSTEEERISKPQLFLLHPIDTSWEHLPEYDSDDLTASSTLLLITPHASYLWLGHDAAARDVEPLRQKAIEKLTLLGFTETVVVIEYQDTASDAFWDAFEAGY